MDNYFKEIIARTLKTNADNLTDDSTVETIPEWDSLTHWTVIAHLENIYNVEFTMDEATEFKNLGDIYATLGKKLKSS